MCQNYLKRIKRLKKKLIFWKKTEVLRVFDGKGGGNAYICQGGGSPDRLELAMDKALSIVIGEINKM
jgi:alanyl-tRNA synthetase